MTLARGIAIGALVIAIVGVAVILLSDGDRAEYKIRFQNAGQLVKGDQIQVGGRPVGQINAIRLTDDNHAEVDFEMEEGFGRLHAGTTGVIRTTSLSGIANRYIQLQPGPNSAPELPDDATIPAERTTTVVDLDQLFNTLDEKTREDLSNVNKGFARQLRGKEQKANLAAQYFAPALNTTQRLVNELTRDQDALTRLIVNGAKVTSALAERRTDLAALVGNANTTTGAIASEEAALSQSLEVLPGTLRKANTTFVNLRATLDDLDVLVDESKPATKDLAPLLRELRPLIDRAVPTVEDLRVLVRRPGANNDLVEAVRKLPRLQRTASPALDRAIATLRKSLPVIEFIRPYTPDLVGWIRDFGQGAGAYDANGHYARIQPIFNTFQLNDLPLLGQVLQPRDPDQRFQGLQTGLFLRCPGAATQSPSDNSAPWRDSDGDLDCDPTQVPPGP